MEAYFEIDDDNITDLIDNDFARLDTVDEIGCRVDDLEASADDLYQKANELSKKVEGMYKMNESSPNRYTFPTAFQAAAMIREMRRNRARSSRIRRLL
jgi:uncharacterized protein YoxC